MPAKKLKEFLDSRQVKYVTINHSAPYTAQEVASLAHIRGKELAKTVMVNVDGKPAMAVLPASYKVDLNLLKLAADAETVALASEAEFKGLFPDCETGAMPPFGNLYGMVVLAEERLTKDDEIAFNAGSHRELIRLAYKDFERLVQPGIGKFANTHSG
jgi:Ala-tRNA(Pro) deacylase